ncbi:uncharacterized protein N7482_004005 [Penicillium canariense]|uniref:Retrovirus-related Pol polyprotein from transposon TNT 1-94-like beta-barrel domain-containing protein n=1 Tax=Penicillium canariense TaxID=189055 RepID=A0A9W9I5S9_9EURO|nr:uncharacterized protein N7482_004005 [Penicillium canariense]KAJ5168411.1 hypothetical protein N7482_004005 [Penicillium canariense]
MDDLTSTIEKMLTSSDVSIRVLPGKPLAPAQAIARDDKRMALPRSLEVPSPASQKTGRSQNHTTQPAAGAIVYETPPTGSQHPELNRLFEYSAVLDSGASRHVTFQREWYTSFAPSKGFRVTGVGDFFLNATGVGTAQVSCNTGGKKVYLELENTLFVPNIRTSLISVSQLLEQGAYVTFEQVDEKMVGTVRINGQVFTASEMQGVFFMDMWQPTDPKVSKP